MVSRSCYLPCSWTSHGLGQIMIWFMCFLRPWQVNKAGANANKEVLSDFSGKKTTKKEKAALWCPLDIFVNTSLQHDPLIITTKLTFQSTKRPTGFSPNISHKLNNNWLKWLCNQSCQWEKNNGLCNICNIMKTAITTCNITVSPQSQ